MHSKWKILEKIVLYDNNHVIIYTKTILIFHGVWYCFNNDSVFKQIYYTIILRKTMNVITQRHRKCGWRQWLACIAPWRRIRCSMFIQLFNFVYFHSGTLKWPCRDHMTDCCYNIITTTPFFVAYRRKTTYGM